MRMIPSADRAARLLGLAALLLHAGAQAAQAPLIAFIPGVGGDAYYGSVQCGIEAAARARGAQVQTQAPKSFDPASQIPILEAMVAKKPDAIIIAPTDGKALFAPLKRATEMGITLVLVDTTLDDASIAVSAVSSDNAEAGRLAGEEMVRLLGGRKGAVLTVNLSPGVSTTDDRERGFAQAIQAAGLRYLGQQFSNNSVQKADQIVSASLLANPDLVGIFSTAAFNTEGAVAALRAARKGDQVVLVGFNANPPGIEALKKGTVAAQVVLKPYDSGRMAGEQALNALQGRPVQQLIRTGAAVATRQSLQQPQVARHVYSFQCPPD
ncbi:ABC transporter substrate-binding protein [Delftia sp. PS-11]|uniref:ABC transporter substrate-binding protein n=1 Tax=Delftia sp. PS-11 TaxID=2767222 RepID=UPI00245413B0|nr:ABC transporter substrate-binding protein [Delftia sp. PS-11]KAJ8745341.1 substrate-binding domain-containing protein [Delftia sp. PS-11]